MIEAGVKHVLGRLSPGLSAYTADVVFTHPGGSAELRYTYEREGRMYVGGVRFGRVRAYRFRSESHCTAWHIEGAYDTLVEVQPSGWVDELVAAQPSGNPWPWRVRHFLIFVDDAGAYEVAAEDCEWLPEQAAS